MKRIGVALAVVGALVCGVAVGRAQTNGATVSVVSTALVGFGQVSVVRAQNLEQESDVCLVVYESPSLGTSSMVEVRDFYLCR